MNFKVNQKVYIPYHTIEYYNSNVDYQRVNFVYPDMADYLNTYQIIDYIAPSGSLRIRGWYWHPDWVTPRNDVREVLTTEELARINALNEVKGRSLDLGE